MRPPDEGRADGNSPDGPAEHLQTRPDDDRRGDLLTEHDAGRDPYGHRHLAEPAPRRSWRERPRAILVLILAVLLVATTAVVVAKQWTTTPGPQPGQPAARPSSPGPGPQPSGPAPSGKGQAPGAWSVHESAGDRTITDSRGTVWGASSGIEGGRSTTSDADVADTASPELYQTMQVGISSWSVPVPVAGRYAVDLMMTEAQGAKPGARVFDVVADGGAGSSTLVDNLDLAALAGSDHAFHVTGAVPVTSGTLTLTFDAHAGEPVASALAVTSYGPIAANSTLFEDDFSGSAGSAPNSKYWSNEVGARRDDGIEGYTEDRANSSLDGQGHLAITARKESYSGPGGNADFTSGRVVSKDKVSFGYGHVEARIKVPAGAGLWPAFWALGSNIDQVGYPQCGEIDVMEYLGGHPSTIEAHIHVLDKSNGGSDDHGKDVSIGDDWDSGMNLSDDFHTYAIDYQPGAITFRVDGKAYHTLAPQDVKAGIDWPFDGRPNYLLLNLAVGGWAGDPSPDTAFPATLLFDSVKITS